MAFYNNIRAGAPIPAPSRLDIRLTPNDTPQEQVPIELQPYVSKDQWYTRVTAVIRTASRYVKPHFEMAWALLFLVASIGTPIGMYHLFLNILPEDPGDIVFSDQRFREDYSRLWKARAISFAIWIGVALLFLLPMMIWKSAGAKRINAMLAKWEREDRAVRGPNDEIPTWKIKTPGVLTQGIKLTITIPARQMGTNFQPGAALPPYLVNGPADPAATYNPYNPYQQGFGAPGAYPTNNFGDVPLYTDEKVPMYTGPNGEMPQLADEKVGYHDIRV